jgi:hypothetical protein
MLAAVALAFFVGETVVALLAERDPPKLYLSLPTSSLPHISNEFAAAELEARRRAVIEAEEAALPHVTVYLKNQSTVTGKLARDEDGWITVVVDGSEVGFHSSEVERVERTAAAPPSGGA